MTARPLWFIDKAGNIFNLAAYINFSRNCDSGRVYGSTGQMESYINATLYDIAFAIQEMTHQGDNNIFTIFKGEIND